MVLVRLKGACLAFGTQVLLDKVDLDVNAGERVCVLGRNGEGKSTLLKILNKQIKPDEGLVQHSDTVKIAALQQELPVTDPQTVYEVVASGLGELGTTISEYHEEILKGEHVDLVKLERLQHVIEAHDGWLWQQKVDAILDRLDLPGDASFDSMSGGWQRRVMLAQALVSEPDLLILDEPTNHMDIATIRWLEEQLLQFKGTLLFISHDRAFVQALSTRIIELDRGSIYSWKGTYQGFLEHQEQRLAAEEVQNALFDKRLAEEEVWIRQGIKARRTRNEGRVRSLEKLRKERSARRDVRNQSTMNITQGERSGKLVFEAENVKVAFGDKVIIKSLDLLISRNDRLALIGANGTGKSTLIKLIMEKLPATSGKMRSGVNLDIAYFDQHREALDLNQTVQEIVGEGKQEVMVNGKSRHVLGYLQDFLFSPKRARTPVRALSGGEKNRLLLARLFLRPSNLLILDEPTNDLDIETLELLEEVVANYAGTVILVSHDRDFVNNCVNTCLYFDGTGQINQIVGGYDDVDSYLALKAEQRQSMADSAEQKAKQEKKAESKQTQAETAPAVKKKKLSFKETRELEALPDKIDELENLIDSLQTQVNEADFFSQDDEKTKKVLNQLSECESNLEIVYARWQELDDQ